MPRSHRHKKGQRGGNANNAEPVTISNGPSAWNNAITVVGDGWTQMMNALTLNPAQNATAASSTTLVPIANLNANVPPSASQKGGKGRGKGKGRSRKGGILAAGAVLEQAIVPLALVGLQHTYAKKHRRGNGHNTRRHIRRR
jgi:hypothetical protein